MSGDLGYPSQRQFERPSPHRFPFADLPRTPILRHLGERRDDIVIGVLSGRIPPGIQGKLAFEGAIEIGVDSVDHRAYYLLF